MSFISELKRRNVIRMAGLYIVGAWLILQVSETLLPIFDTPTWVLKLLVYGLFIGFIPTMIVAWIFELTPDGLRRDEEVTPENSIAPQTARRMERIIIALFALALIFFAFDKFVLAPTRDVALVVATSQAVKAEVKAEVQAEELTLGVAVLPFANLSTDPENAFFTVGVYEDVLTYISRIEQLRVISRTSMEKIAKQGMEISQIGKHLGVSHVLEGSVRRSGNKVRVTVQLIKTSNDEHIWAENYDRDLDDIFSIQTEIAKSIAQQLKTELSPAQMQLIESKPTNNLEAYALFVQARELDRVWLGSENFEKQIPLLEKAIQLDPNFVVAEVKLVAAYGRMVWTDADPKGIYKPKAEALKNKIVKEHPNTYAAIAAQGYFEYTVTENYQEALEYFQKALLKRPNDLDTLGYMAASYKRLGSFEKGIELNRKLLSLDPENISSANELVIQLLKANKIDEALAQAEFNIKKYPNDWIAQRSLGDLYFRYLGDVKGYLKFREQSLPIEKLIETDYLYLRLTTNKENIDERIAILNKTKKPNDNTDVDYTIAELLNMVGLEDRSQQKAKLALAKLQKSQKTILPTFKNDPKLMHAVFSLAACLANDKAAFARYNVAYQNAPDAEWVLNDSSKVVHAKALAECGRTKDAWDILNAAILSGNTWATQWDLILDPQFNQYFSELPEYKALQKKLQQKKQAKKMEPAL
jgi:TolB-like protein